MKNQSVSGKKQIDFFPFDPEQLIDQFIPLYIEKVGGNDNLQLNEQIMAIAEILIENECITTNQHQNIASASK